MTPSDNALAILLDSRDGARIFAVEQDGAQIKALADLAGVKVTVARVDLTKLEVVRWEYKGGKA